VGAIPGGDIGAVGDRFSARLVDLGRDSLPWPASLPPKSFTTTFAPSVAANFAISEPTPRPAPVTMTTLPFNTSAMLCLPKVPRDMVAYI
jgi:hypothetical protein